MGNRVGYKLIKKTCKRTIGFTPQTDIPAQKILKKRSNQKFLFVLSDNLIDKQASQVFTTEKKNHLFAFISIRSKSKIVMHSNR